MKEKDYFIEACFAEDLQKFYRDYIKKFPARIMHFDLSINISGPLRIENIPDSMVLSHNYWMPSKYCVETGKELTKETIGITYGYWTPFLWKPIKKNIADTYTKETAYECQKIDTNCNDCKFMERSTSKPISMILNGKCTKFNKNVTFIPNMCSPENIKCFEHRKD